MCCGDWSRVVTSGALSFGSTVGVFLDPPYLGDVRTADLYAVDDHSIANEVREWCLANGDNPRFRIILAGYLPEHDHLIPTRGRERNGRRVRRTPPRPARHVETATMTTATWVFQGCRRTA